MPEGDPLDPLDRRDPLDALREQIRSATDAAERLVRETQSRGETQQPAPLFAGPGIPSAGWEPARAEATSELQALAGLLATLRELLPPELQEQATGLVRQLLVLLRALIDWAVVQIDGGVRGHEHEVEDIPIG
ncbi:MAG: hypothetical protein ACR2ND_00790 [Solirubrobacteraceae bacterium]